MSTNEALLAEMNVLRAAVKAHHDKIVAAQEARSEAIEAAGIETKYGRYQIDFKKDGWRYPSVAQADRLVEELSDDNGYYWACSRLRDLEGILGESIAQLPLRVGNNVFLLRGELPGAHPTVEFFLTENAA